MFVRLFFDETHPRCRDISLFCRSNLSRFQEGRNRKDQAVTSPTGVVRQGRNRKDQAVTSPTGIVRQGRNRKDQAVTSPTGVVRQGRNRKDQAVTSPTGVVRQGRNRKDQAVTSLTYRRCETRTRNESSCEYQGGRSNTTATGAPRPPKSMQSVTTKGDKNVYRL